MFKTLVETLNNEARPAMPITDVLSIRLITPLILRSELDGFESNKATPEQIEHSLTYLKEVCAKPYLVEVCGAGSYSGFTLVDFDQAIFKDDAYQLFYPRIFESKQAALQSLVNIANDI